MEAAPSDGIPTEGVIKFHLDFTLAQPESLEGFKALNAWREILFRLGLTGQASDRYDGLAYGNVSQRISPQGFLVSGTQTGGKPRLSLDDYCRVQDFDLAQNRMRAKGPVKPSSEALTHGAVYVANAQAGCVIHVHSPEIWRYALRLGILTTDASIPYGTPEMGRAVGEAAATGTRGVIAMGGHMDGVLAFAEDAGEAAFLLLQILEKALEFEQ